MQWIQPILHSERIFVCGSYTVMWKSPSFHDRYSSPVNVDSLRTLFKLTKRSCLGSRKTPMSSTYMDSRMVSALTCGQVFWTVVDWALPSSTSPHGHTYLPARRIGRIFGRCHSTSVDASCFNTMAQHPILMVRFFIIFIDVSGRDG